MKTYVLNLFIVSENKLMLTGLKNDLDNRFGTNINISTFQNNDEMLKKIEKYTNIVILNYLDDENGNRVLNSIKEINPKIEIIFLSNSEIIGNAIASFGNETTEYVVKEESSWYNKILLFYKTITHPIQELVNGIKVYKFPTLF